MANDQDSNDQNQGKSNQRSLGSFGYLSFEFVSDFEFRIFQRRMPEE